MKFQAPREVTALSCAGAEITPDAQGCFEAAEIFASELRTHGCTFPPQTEQITEPPRAGAFPASSEVGKAKKRQRLEKAD